MTTGISRQTKEDFSKILKVKKRGQNYQILKMKQHFGKEYGVKKIEQKRGTEWIDKANQKIPSEKQNTVKITKEDVKRKVKLIPEWKGEGPDKIQSFWLKYFTAVREVLATILN